MRNLLAAALVACSFAVAAPAAAASLDGPLTVVVGYAPGGASDRIARLIGDALQQRLGVPVIVENKPGAGGRIAAQAVARAGGQDNVLMLGNPAVMVVAPLVIDKPGYDVERDFQPVSIAADYRFGLAVPASSSVRDLASLRGWLKDHPTQFNVGVPATGSLPHFFALMIAERLGMSAEVVGYRGSAPLVTELVGGHVPIAVDTYDTLQPQHAAGKIRLVAVSGDKREPATPDVPTFREAGLPLSGSGWNAFFAPAAMPADKVALLGREISAVMAEPAIQQAVRAAGMEPVVADPARTAELLRAYRAQWEPVIRQSGFKAQS